VFVGWYVEKNGVYRELTSSKQITSNLTLYAKWTICEEEDECVVNTDIAPDKQPDLNLYFVVGENPTDHYIIMDRNV
jgi:uncharacterized repeat protein (TIGR02543 family)